MSSDETDLLQIQNDRLVVNWRKTHADAIYPRHEALLSRLEKVWGDFVSYLRKSGHPLPKWATVECAYVNSFGLDSDIANTVSIFSRSFSSLPGEDEGVQFQLSRKLGFANAHGRLVITGAPSPSDDLRAVRPYILTVTSKIRGELIEGDFPAGILAEAHSASVDAFTAITTTTRHKEWGRQA